MAAVRDLILGARIGSETRRDPVRKTMIAFAAAFAVCTATVTSGTPAAFARGGGSIGAGTHGFGGGGFGGHGFATCLSLGFGLLEPIAALTTIAVNLPAHRAMTDAQNFGDAFLARPTLAQCINLAAILILYSPIIASLNYALAT